MIVDGVSWNLTLILGISYLADLIVIFPPLDLVDLVPVDFFLKSDNNVSACSGVICPLSKTFLISFFLVVIALLYFDKFSLSTSVSPVAVGLIIGVV